jgi:hypothetical protein
MPQFERYIGIDYSRAETADSICNGFLAYIAECNGTPKQFEPPLQCQRSTWAASATDCGYSRTG